MNIFWIISLYFQERRSELLAHCRLQIKSAVSFCNKDVRDVQKRISALNTRLEQLDSSSSLTPQFLRVWKAPHFSGNLNTVQVKISKLSPAALNIFSQEGCAEGHIYYTDHWWEECRVRVYQQKHEEDHQLSQLQVSLDYLLLPLMLKWNSPHVLKKLYSCSLSIRSQSLTLRCSPIEVQNYSSLMQLTQKYEQFAKCDGEWVLAAQMTHNLVVVKKSSEIVRTGLSLNQQTDKVKCYHRSDK